MKRVLLVSMPFANIASPSLGLSLLKAGLTRDGLPCDIRYLNLDFARHIGAWRYDRIANFMPDLLLGDWIFAAEVFGDRIPAAERYFAEAVHPTFTQTFEHERAETYSADRDGEILEVQAQVGAYLDECLASVPGDDYALVGFTSTFGQTLASVALAQRLKARYPHLAVTFGGANCEGEMGIALHRLFPAIDYVCSGEGDLVFPLLARRILRGEPAGDVPAIIQRVGAETVVPQRMSAPVKDLGALPYPDYDDFVAQWNAADLGDPAATYLSIETARGCWWGQKSHCTFCGLNGSTIGFRAKSPERAVDELMQLVERYGPQRIAAVDNIIDMRYFRDVLPRLAELNLGVELFYETKSNLRKEQVRLLREAGVTRIQPGIESLNSNVLRLMRKGVAALQNIQLLRWCAEYMVHPGWNLLAGFPGEDPADYARQAEIVPLLTHLPPPLDVAPLRLDRFSPLFEHAEASGVRNVRASQAYRYVYPFSPPDLDALAYYFDFDYADRRNPASYIGPLRQQVEVWRNDAIRGQLMALVEGDALVVRDTRPVAVQKEHRLAGLRRAVYEYCDQAHTRAEIEAHLRLPDAGEGTGEGSLSLVLDELLRLKLLLHEDGAYLSLAVWGGYQVRFLMEQVGRALSLQPEPTPAVMA
jgi:ribosomal peptide maturation radical SAM protein 1